MSKVRRSLLGHETELSLEDIFESGAEVFKLKILNRVPFLQAIPGPFQRIPSRAIRFWEYPTYSSGLGFNHIKCLGKENHITPLVPFRRPAGSVGSGAFRFFPNHPETFFDVVPLQMQSLAKPAAGEGKESDQGLYHAGI